MSQINFVAEFRAIMETCRRDSVSGRTRLLWIALFYLANDRALEDEQTGAWEWPDEFFPVNNAELATHCPLEKRALLEARNRLKQMGVIDFKAGDNAMKPAKYRMKYLSASQWCKNAPQGVPQHAPQGVPQHVPQDAPQGVPYYININKGISVNPERYDDDDDDDVDIHAGAREEDEPDPIEDRAERGTEIGNGFRYAVGRSPLPAELDRLVVSSWRMGFRPEMVSLALRKAAGRGAGSPVDYALEILSEWRRKEARTPEQVDEVEIEFLKDNGKCGLYGSGDPVEDYRQREAARERRRQENLRVGVG